MSTKERLKKYIKYLNIPISAFEKSIGVGNAYVNSISQSIQPDKLLLIVEKYPDLNIEWLIIGKGEMLKSYPGSQLPAHSPQPDEHLSEPSAGYYPTSVSQENQLLRQHIIALERTIRDKEEIIRLLKSK